MARVKGAMMTRKRRNKTLKLAKSYWGSKSRHFKMAKQAVAKSGVYAYVGRKLKKREFRQLWISRISAAVAPYGINYSRFMNGLKKSGIEMNRKALSELAIADAEAFKVLVETAKKAIGNFKRNGAIPQGIAPFSAVKSARRLCLRALAFWEITSLPAFRELCWQLRSRPDRTSQEASCKDRTRRGSR